MKTALIFLVFACASFGALIPSDNITSWTPGVNTGVPGGIPARPSGAGTLIDVTASPYFADNTGATDAQPAIQSAIAASAPGSVIYLPAGTYRCDSPISILEGAGYTNRVIRGAGATLTKIDSRTYTAISIGTADSLGPPVFYTYADITVSAGLTQGSTQLTVGNSAGYVNDALLVMVGQNSASIPMGSVYQDNYNMRQVSKITGRPTSTTVTFTPPLIHDFGGGSLTVYGYTGANGAKAYSIGIEELEIDMTNSMEASISGIVANQLRDSWIRNCTFTGIASYPINAAQCGNLEITGNRINPARSGGSNRAGMLFVGGSGHLVENNILLEWQPLIEVNGGTAGMFVSRNYAVGLNAFGFDTNHAPGNKLNLYEGNFIDAMMCDGYFGGASNDTFYRNYNIGPSSLKRMTRNYVFAGNFLNQQIVSGDPNIGNTSFTGTADYPGTPGLDWGTGYGLAGTLTTRSGDNSGVITMTSSVGSIVVGRVIQVSWDGGWQIQKYMEVTGVSGLLLTVGPPPNGIFVGPAFPTAGTAITLGAGVEGFQEKDLGVARTLTKKGNRYLDDNSFDSLGGDTLVDSLVYSAKPQWMLDAEAATGQTFNLAAWDPVTPVTPASNRAAAELIPAGWRY